MQADLTDITIILDRSGSMRACQGDAEGGMNQFIEDQKKLPGRAAFSLVQFDDEYMAVHRGVNIQDVPKCHLSPRGGTALLGAVGRTVTDIGERLGKVPDADRPGLVVVVIITDGEENSSHRHEWSKHYTKEKVKAMIEHQTAAYKWQFTYLGANVDAFAEGGAIGLTSMACAGYTEKTAGAAFAAVSNNVMRMRSASAGGQHVNSNYTAAERDAMKPGPAVNP